MSSAQGEEFSLGKASTSADAKAVKPKQVAQMRM